MKIKKLLGYKTFGAQTHSSFYKEEDEPGKIVFGHNLSATTIATTFASSETTLKIILIYV